MIEILDELMEEFGKKIDGNIYEYEGKTYKLFCSHQTEKVCYYIEVR